MDKSKPIANRIVRMVENDQPERPAYSFNQLAESGLLWFINRSLLNPQGFALALNYADGETEPRGWSITASDGPIMLITDHDSVGWRVPTYDEPITVIINGDFEREKFNNIMSLLNYARNHGRVPEE